MKYVLPVISANIKDSFICICRLCDTGVSMNDPSVRCLFATFMLTLLLSVDDLQLDAVLHGCDPAVEEAPDKACIKEAQIAFLALSGDCAQCYKNSKNILIKYVFENVILTCTYP